MGKLAGKVAIITGGARGMGAATSRLFVAEGARIAIADVLEADGAALAAELGEAARFYKLDVTSEDDWARVVAAAEADLGPVDVLVNNAGILMFKSILETSKADYERVLGVNLVGEFLGIKAVAPGMIARGKGSIVNISSVAALLGSGGPTAYSASKGAVRLLSKSVALYCAEQKLGIRCNSVHPGGVDTPIFNPLWQAMGHEQGKALIGSHHPIGRMAEPNDLGELILWLASDRSAFVTGAEVVADGAYTTGLRRRTGFGPS